mgnify:CR=1 FL=1
MKRSTMLEKILWTACGGVLLSSVFLTPEASASRLVVPLHRQGEILIVDDKRLKPNQVISGLPHVHLSATDRRFTIVAVEDRAEAGGILAVVIDSREGKVVRRIPLPAVASHIAVSVDGGFATHVISDARYTYHLPERGNASEIAPLLCAGLIGWRSLAFAGSGDVLGLYGFGAAAHIVIQIARWQHRRVFAFTRPGDVQAQALARELGAEWVGASGDEPPDPMDAAIIYAPVGDLVPLALKHVRRGGRVVCAGIHMTDIPSFPYSDLWGERRIMSVANLTRQDAHDFLALAPQIGLKISTTIYPLEDANRALADLRAGTIKGAAVLVP